MTAELYNWEAVTVDGGVILTGKCLNHKTLPNYASIKTSSIKSAFMSGLRLHVVTKSGTVYKLGMPDSSWVRRDPLGRCDFQKRFLGGSVSSSRPIL